VTVTATTTEIAAADLTEGMQIVTKTGRVSEPIADITYSTATFGSQMVSFTYGKARDGFLPAVGVRVATDRVVVVTVASA